MNALNALDQLWELLCLNPKEFDIAILRSPDDNTKNPFVLQEGHLGLHAGDLPWLARDFRTAYRTARLQDCDSVLKVTSCLLLVCPDHATAWADRKRALLSVQCHEDLWTRELDFVNLLMTRHTKAPTSWFHRKFVLQQRILQLLSALPPPPPPNDDHDDQENTFSTTCTTTTTCIYSNMVQLARDEIQICARIADRYPKNYYAWTHRSQMLQKIHHMLQDDSTSGTRTLADHYTQLLQDQWQSTTRWLQSHVSDHSAAHYGGMVLQLLRRQQLQQHNPQDHHQVPDNDTTQLVHAMMISSITVAQQL
eukprot:Sro1378_g267590.4  (307) ;mRNA; f:1690-2611